MVINRKTSLYTICFFFSFLVLYPLATLQARQLRQIFIPKENFQELIESNHGKKARLCTWQKVLDLLEQDERNRREDKRKEKEEQEEEKRKDWVTLGASFKGEERNEHFLINASYKIQIQRPGWHAIALLDGDMAISRARLDGKEAKLIHGKPKLKAPRNFQIQQQAIPFDSSSPFHVLIPGEVKGEKIHEVELEFILPIERVDYYKSCSFNLLPAPKSKLRLKFQESELDVSIDQGLGLKTSEREGRTEVDCALQTCSSVDIRWFKMSLRAKKKKREKSPSSKERNPQFTKLPSYVEGSLFQDIAIGEGRMTGTVTIDLSIYRKGISDIAIDGPANTLEHLELLQRGNLVEEWSADEESGDIQLSLRRPKEGNLRLSFLYYTDTKGQSSFKKKVPCFRLRGVNRQWGYVTLRRKTNVSIKAVDSSENLEALPLKSIPRKYQSAAVAKALLAYRYLEPPFDLLVQVTRYRDAEVITTMIDHLKASTLIAPNGNCMTKLDFKIRSRTRSPLSLDFRKCGEIEIGRILLDGKPTDLSHQEKEIMEVSLSDLKGAAADEASNLTVSYHHKLSPLEFSGNLALSLPSLGATAKELSWTWNVPKTLSFFAFSGNHNKLIRDRGSSPFPINSGAYRKYKMERVLLPKGRALEIESSYISSTVQWFPALLFLLGGILFVHSCLISLIDGQKKSLYLSFLIVAIVILILFSKELHFYFPSAYQGMTLYIIALLLYCCFILGRSLRAALTKNKDRELTAVETNIARVAPEVEGGDSDEN